MILTEPGYNMSGSTHTTINFDKAGDDLPTANSNIRDRNRGDNSTSSSVSYDNRPVGNGRTNDNGDGRGAWRNNDNRENEGIIAGNNSTNSLYNGPHSGANMLENASYVTVNKSTLTNVSGISSKFVQRIDISTTQQGTKDNVSFNPGPRNAATDRKTNGRGMSSPLLCCDRKITVSMTGNRPTAGDNDTESGANDVGGRQNFPGRPISPSIFDQSNAFLGTGRRYPLPMTITLPTLTCMTIGLPTILLPLVRWLPLSTMRFMTPVMKGK